MPIKVYWLNGEVFLLDILFHRTRISAVPQIAYFKTLE